jgi:hypothetical protein
MNPAIEQLLNQVQTKQVAVVEPLDPAVMAKIVEFK